MNTWHSGKAPLPHTIAIEDSTPALLGVIPSGWRGYVLDLLSLYSPEVVVARTTPPVDARTWTPVRVFLGGDLILVTCGAHIWGDIDPTSTAWSPCTYKATTFRPPTLGETAWIALQPAT